MPQARFPSPKRRDAARSGEGGAIESEAKQRDGWGRNTRRCGCGTTPTRPGFAALRPATLVTCRMPFLLSLAERWQAKDRIT